MQHQVMRRQVLQHVAQVVHVRIDEERDLERGAGLVEMAVAQADIAEAGDGAEMARLEPQGLGDVEQAVRIALLDRGERRPLVPGLRPSRDTWSRDDRGGAGPA